MQVPVSQGLGLARPGPCNHAYTALGTLDGFPLTRIKTTENILHGFPLLDILLRQYLFACWQKLYCEKLSGHFYCFAEITAMLKSLQAITETLSIVFQDLIIRKTYLNDWRHSFLTRQCITKERLSSQKFAFYINLLTFAFLMKQVLLKTVRNHINNVTR